MKLKRVLSGFITIAMAFSFMVVPAAAADISDETPSDKSPSYGHVRGYIGNFPVDIDGDGEGSKVKPEDAFHFYITLGNGTKYYFPTFSDAITASLDGFYIEMSTGTDTRYGFFCDCSDAGHDNSATKDAFLNRDHNVVIHSENNNNSVTIAEDITITDEVHFILASGSSMSGAIADAQNVSFTGQITIQSGGSLIQERGGTYSSANVTLTNPIKVESGGSLSLVRTGGAPEAKPTVWRLASSSSETAVIDVAAGGSLTLTDVNVGSSNDETTAISTAGKVTITPYIKEDTTITSIEVKSGGELSMPDSDIGTTNVTSIEIEANGNAELNLGEIQSVSLAEGASAVIDDANINQVSMTNGASVTLGENFGDTKTEITLPEGASVTVGGTTVTAGDGENKISSSGMVTFAPGATSGEGTTPMNAAVLLSDGTLIEGSSTEAPKVETTDDGTTVTVPAGGSVTKDGTEEVYENGGSVSQNENGVTETTENKPEPTPPPVIVPSDPTYPPEITESENGSVSTSPSRPEQGDKVTITTEPDEGYKVDTVTVVDEDGDRVTVSNAGDGKYTFTQPKGEVTITVTFVWDNPFTDINDPEQWYYEAVEYVEVNGLMAGLPGGLFAPNKELTRAEAVQILYNLEGQPTVTGDATFTDLTDDWYVKAIAWAETNGVVDGYGDGTFHPNDTVTREEFAQMMYNYTAFKKLDTSATADLTKFPDGNEVGAWAKTAMEWANGNKLINGHANGTLDPAGTTIRAQAASILMNFDLNLVKAE